MPNKAQKDLEAEQAILAALMSEKNIYKQIDLTIQDFSDKMHQQIYKIIIELAEEGLEPEYVAVSSKIQSLGMEGTIPKMYIFDLCEKIPGAITKQWQNYVAIIKRKSAVRMLNVLGLNLTKIAKDGFNGLSTKIDDAIRQLGEIKEKAENKGRSKTEVIREWVNATSGDFNATDCAKELGFATERDKHTMRKVLQRFERDNFIIRCGKRNGCYRLIERDAPLIDFLNVNLTEPYPVKWPFGIHEVVDIYPGNVIVVAGAANAGKTAFLLNVAKMNMNRLKVEYFSSEMGPEELHLRLKKFNDVKLSDWNFAARTRSSKFSDVIVPDALNIIDYLEVTKDFYEVGGDIKDIFDRLGKGIAVIALQKKSGTDFGRGGEFTMEKPRLYLSIESGQLKIVKGKNWANPEVNPNNMTWKFKLVQGSRFIETGGSAWDLV